MGNFTTDVVYNTVFDGDDITIKMKRLKVSHMKTLSPFIIRNDDGKVTMEFETLLDFVIVAAPILLECITSFEGCNDKDGKPIEFGTVVESNYFLTMLSGILDHLMSCSMVGSDEKKSESTSPDTQQVQVEEI